MATASGQPPATAVQVHVRIKPSSTEAVFPSDEGVVVEHVIRGVEEVTTHDGFASIVASNCEQEDAFGAIAAPLLDRLREGYSCTLLAYGQTGSGKTHTIFGPPGVLTEAALLDSADGVPAEWGLFPRIALELLAAGTGTLHCSAIEVYQEKAYDLLQDRVQLAVGTQKAGRKTAGTKDKGNDAVHKSTCKCRDCYLAKEREAKARKEALEAGRPPPKPGTRVPAAGAAPAAEVSFATIGERHMPLSSPADVATLSRTIELTRTAVGHLLNARSSRSHCLVHLHVDEQIGSTLRKRHLLFADLAGSERILKTGAEGDAAKQAVAINTSLSALGKCVRALAARADYVPYRESTLTQLLRSSLSGKACLSAVVTVASDAAYVEESKCSLEYGQRMGAVRTRASVVQSTSAESELQLVHRKLSKARPELAEMEANGYAEKFGKAAIPGEVQSFKDNRAHLNALVAVIAKDKVVLAEMQGRGQGSGRPAQEVKHRLHEAQMEAKEVGELVASQLSIPGFLIAPRAVYTRKLAEVRALEERLQQLSDAASGGRSTPSNDISLPESDGTSALPQQENRGRRVLDDGTATVTLS
uniref:Kinesin motor domain-containing protein n=1 Tax=Haptolina brevifila TaxID=156173 RepID=A0A7S2CM31_9EUKA|mmetsp:Transcript_2663/g.5577  ORF Transcript_2663/g.5577 Transcript_2663/m.5577 type:complete len:587 (+) Transcript_2663:71-1831(+)|eukprot:CAMPEP_0174754836 /NCGR_PEP_ID=MMETSP1094-20130205/105936_1 /TAXON_ID=156173 /ORGANISM="Chrysochromulina brevifilum, Strain UTEX LB 985" /LENGTH=586 /DNA_ID=CAMNT_0015960719 /DNA_START=65 /DNA_END=1825 /DNA_ORIENTATION=-